MSDAAQVQTIFLITGPVQGGKTTFLKELVELLKEREISVGGFLCPGSFDSGDRSGFDLKNIGTGMELPMASALETEEWIKYRRFWFNPDAFKQGIRWIQASRLLEPDVVVIDEVGPMELEGLGWSDLLKSLVISPIPVQLWSVRENLLGEVMQKWDISPKHLIRIDQLRVELVAELITGIVKKSRESKPSQ
jgi:nucleoside-triphosphatase